MGKCTVELRLGYKFVCMVGKGRMNLAETVFQPLHLKTRSTSVEFFAPHVATERCMPIIGSFGPIDLDPHSTYGYITPPKTGWAQLFFMVNIRRRCAAVR
jgi:hypothetical protein